MKGCDRVNLIVAGGGGGGGGGGATKGEKGEGVTRGESSSHRNALRRGERGEGDVVVVVIFIVLGTLGWSEHAAEKSAGARVDAPILAASTTSGGIDISFRASDARISRVGEHRGDG